MRSIPLFDEVLGKSFDPLVEFSGVLTDPVFHLARDIEGSDDVVVLGGRHTSSSVFLTQTKTTFFK